MNRPPSLTELTAAEQALWQRVVDLWAWSQSRDRERIAAALHPNYVGWDMSAPRPHDRAAAVGSVLGDAAELLRYALEPLSVQVYADRVGVVHYADAATVRPRDGEPRDVTGKWTEVYLKQDDAWLMIAVSGRPDAASGGASESGKERQVP